MVKRVLDVTLTLLGAPVAAAVTGVMALALALELRGNPVFIQERVGLHGKRFRMVKLRTMRYARADEEAPRIVDDFETYVFSPADAVDPRLTPLGAFARRTSLDELPNLINVFLGQMSLIGPRPEIPEIVAQYPSAYHRRHDVLPGIAGLAQVEGRSDLAYAETIKYDLAYVDKHSVLIDLRILAKSAAAVARGSGAR